MARGVSVQGRAMVGHLQTAAGAAGAGFVRITELENATANERHTYVRTYITHHLLAGTEDRAGSTD